MNTDTHQFARIVVAAVVVLLLMTGQALAQPACGYEVTIIAADECDIGSAPAVGLGISEDGTVVGDVDGCLGGPDRAFIWTPESGMELLPMPAGTSQSQALDIAGTHIAGWLEISGDDLGHVGFIHDGKEAITFGTLPGGNFSQAHAINSSLQVVGYWGDSVNGNPSREAFIWEDGRMLSLAPYLGTPKSDARDINTAGDVTGWMGSSVTNDGNAYIWSRGVVTVLPPIPGGFTSEGRAINDRGDVAGRGRMIDPRTGEVVRLAFAWIDGEMIMLGTLPGYPQSFAWGINNDRTVVGYVDGSGTRAFVWHDGVMADLNDLVPPEPGFNVLVASAINEAGQIAGTASINNHSVAVLLTPIETLIGDLDGDCDVGIPDLLILLTDWGPCNGCPSDLDGNGSVGVSDLLILLANWG